MLKVFNKSTEDLASYFIASICAYVFNCICYSMNSALYFKYAVISLTNNDLWIRPHVRRTAWPASLTHSVRSIVSLAGPRAS